MIEFNLKIYNDIRTNPEKYKEHIENWRNSIEPIIEQQKIKKSKYHELSNEEKCYYWYTEYVVNMILVYITFEGQGYMYVRRMHKSKRMYEDYVQKCSPMNKERRNRLKQQPHHIIYDKNKNNDIVENTHYSSTIDKEINYLSEEKGQVPCDTMLDGTQYEIDPINTNLTSFGIDSAFDTIKTVKNSVDDISSTTINIDVEKKKLEKYEMVNHPTHYNSYSVEVIEMFLRIYGPEKTACWCEMTALKYRMRMGTKPGNSIQQDLDKEKWYLDKAADLRKLIKDERQ